MSLGIIRDLISAVFGNGGAWRHDLAKEGLVEGVVEPVQPVPPTVPAAPQQRPLVMIHGYSSTGQAFYDWRGRLVARGIRDIRNIFIGTYRTLTNELTIKDIGEGFGQALCIQAGLGEDEPFDAIVHSTGMLVVRCWLTTDPERRIPRLKHLIGLAPATFGSPLAHKGRSFLGAIFKGNHAIGPDFLAAGDLVLDGLELGSRLIWDLATKDLFGELAYYGPDADTPYVFVFCGTVGYPFPENLAVHEPGTDGTVRWAGVSLNSRKIILDLRTPSPAGGGAVATPRITIGDWKNVSDIPVTFAEGLNHGTIMHSPPDPLVTQVVDALAVTDEGTWSTWCASARTFSRPPERWQQFVVRAVDEHGDPVTDYNIQICRRNAQGELTEDAAFCEDVHTYAADNSLRCFHVKLSALQDGTALCLHLRASTGSRFVGFRGVTDPPFMPLLDDDSPAGDLSAALNLTPLIAGDPKLAREPVAFFYPFTTTLVEIRLSRVPLPFTEGVPNDVYRFGDWAI